jgi:cbb3-type cytochrome oxidase maturation protein
MYYPYFISYMLAGVAIAVVVFAWALKNGQFQDQRRARFLPLYGAPRRAPVKASKVSRIEVVSLFALAIIGLCVSFSTVIFALLRVP